MKFVLALLLACEASAAIRDACASGCTYATAQAAIDAAADGDAVELKAGENFSRIHIVKSNITVRSSRWRELPAPGYRVTPSHVALMPTITGAGDTAVRIGHDAFFVTKDSVNTTTNQIGLTNTSFSLTNSAVVVGASVLFDINESCGACAVAALPAPLQERTRYYIASVSGSLITVSLTPGGAAVDLTSIGSSDNASDYARPSVLIFDEPKNVMIQGIHVTSTLGTYQPNLVVIGSASNNMPEVAGSNGTTLQSMLIRGPSVDFGDHVRDAVQVLSSTHVTIADSFIHRIFETQLRESHAIAVIGGDRIVVRNNYISAAGIPLLTGGQNSAERRVTTNFSFTGNFVEKPGYMAYKSGAGAPSGSCYYGGVNDTSGQFYRNTSPSPNTCANGACYVCQSNSTWAQDTGAVYRSASYGTKNLFELKDCEACFIHGNYLSGGYAGPDGGQGWCCGISLITAPPGSGAGSGYIHAEGVTFSDNWIHRSYSGFWLAAALYPPATWDNLPPARNIVMENNLLTGLAEHPALAQWSDHTSSPPFCASIATGYAGLVFARNTCRPVSGSIGLYGIRTVLSTSPTPQTNDDVSIRDNLIWTTNPGAPANYPLLMEGGYTCAIEYSRRPASTDVRWRSNVFYGGDTSWFLTACTNQQNTAFLANDTTVAFTSAANHRLAASSNYSAANGSASFLSTNSSDVGADIDWIEQYALPAQAGTPDYPTLLRIKPSRLSSTSVSVAWRPASGQSCTAYVGKNTARNVAANQEANSTGTADAYSNYTATFTGLAAGRKWYELVCASPSMKAVGYIE